jgi:hypothetical protein
MHIFDPCCFSSDLPGVNSATNDRMILYYCFMTKGDRSLAIVRYFLGRVVTRLIDIRLGDILILINLPP